MNGAADRHGRNPEAQPDPELRAAASEIFRRGLAAADGYDAVRRAIEVRGESLHFRGSAGTAGATAVYAATGRVWVVGAGKASAVMAAAAEQALGERVAGGAVCVRRGHGSPLTRIDLFEGGHPLPDAAGARGARAIRRTVRGARERDLVLNLVSGGGSALLSLPAPGIRLEDLRRTTELLLLAGAGIHELNAVRKHLTLLAGGGLAALARGPVVSLIVSDVPGDRLDSISSGPTAPDPTTYADAWEALAARGLIARIPPRVAGRLQAGLRGELPETRKRDDPAFARAHNLIVASNRDALDAAQAAAEERGWVVERWPGPLTGEAREAGARFARELLARPAPAGKPFCLLAGGETTVAVRGRGRGGRNQELVLGAAGVLDGRPGALVLSAGTDGNDGPTDAAGAFADGGTLARARSLGLDAARALRENDAYPFFQRLADLVATGPTRTNVMDVQIGLRRPAAGAPR